MEGHPATISKEDSRRIRAAIRLVFLEVWDPIGIHDEPNAQDEYDGYVDRALDLLVKGATDAEIENYLLWIVDRMGMDASRAGHSEVIVALRAIDISTSSRVEQSAVKK